MLCIPLLASVHAFAGILLWSWRLTSIARAPRRRSIYSKPRVHVNWEEPSQVHERVDCSDCSPPQQHIPLSSPKRISVGRMRMERRSHFCARIKESKSGWGWATGTHILKGSCCTPQYKSYVKAGKLVGSCWHYYFLADILSIYVKNHTYV